MRLLTRAHQARPEDPRIFSQLQTGLRHAALACERRIVDLEHALHQQDQDLAMRAQLADTYSDLAQIYCHQERPCCACRCIKRAIELEGERHDLTVSLARALFHATQYRAALRIVTRLVESNPEDADSLVLLGKIHEALSDCNAAEKAYDRVLRIHAMEPEALPGKSRMLAERGETAAALRLLSTALNADPSNAKARYLQGIYKLRTGDYTDGWKGYESRFEACGVPHPRFVQPRWLGEALAGKRILVYVEQGNGDVIQFLRFLPLMRKRGATVIFASYCGFLNLARRSDGIDELVDLDLLANLRIDFDFHIPIASLPYALDITLGNLPSDVPYVHVDPNLRRQWRKRVGSDDSLKVGLVWGGNVRYARDAARSMDPACFAGLREVPGIRFFSLQKDRPGEVERLREVLPVTPLGEELGDFADTAALILNLDLLISVCTAPAHLAGALGRPVWTLLHVGADWRWMERRSDSPWYPTMRLFRQSHPGDWTAVINQVREELLALRHAT